MRMHRRRAILLGGDTAALLLFAAVGRRNHGEGLQITETFNTALPFLVGMFRTLFSKSIVLIKGLSMFSQFICLYEVTLQQHVVPTSSLCLQQQDVSYQSKCCCMSAKQQHL